MVNVCFMLQFIDKYFTDCVFQDFTKYKSSGMYLVHQNTQFVDDALLNR